MKSHQAFYSFTYPSTNAHFHFVLWNTVYKLKPLSRRLFTETFQKQFIFG